MGATIATHPAMSNPDLKKWFATTNASIRTPGSAGFAYIQRVPLSTLPVFTATMTADPLSTATPGAQYAILPPGDRGEYCLARLAVVAPGAQQLASAASLSGLDLCQSTILGLPSPIAALLASARNSGTPSVANLKLAGVSLVIFQPVYSHGPVPSTEVARQADLIGWVMASFDASAIVTAVVSDTPELAVRLTRPGAADESAAEVAIGGTVPMGVALLSTRVDLEASGAWNLDVTGPAEPAGPSSTIQGLALTASGIALSLLVFFVVRLLAGSRQRAYTLVEQKTTELQHQALHDDLTGLANRSLVIDRAEQMLARCRRQSQTGAALFLDVDGFKSINDTLGHAAGNRLLIDMADRIRATLRESDTAGRLGGDEFVILVEGAAGVAEAVAERILEVVRQPFSMDDVSSTDIGITASIGIASGDRQSAEDLLRDADLALYEAKSKGKDRYAVFHSAMQTQVEDRAELHLALRGALERDEFFLVYQPTFSLSDERMTGVEALLRWNHPRRGVVSPLDFIPLAEESGLIIPIGRFVLREACRQAVLWQREGRPFQMAINVSARQFDSPVLVTDVRDALAESGLAASSLTVEITESVLMRDFDAAADRLQQLRALGVRAAIDDFGTGYSSLAYLRRFPVDALKIDRSFISGIADSPAASALIHTLVQLGKTLGLETVAEGIEDRAQLEHLQREHCDTGQGFLLARPVDAAVMGAMLDRMDADSSLVA